MKDIDLRGIIPAIVTPMTNEGELDLRALRRYVQWLAEQGPVALAVNVDTGEGPHLTADEKRQTLETVAEAVAGTCKVVGGVAGPSTAQGVANARAALAAGADALLVFPISAFLGQPLNPEVPYRYHAAIAEAVDLPLILFQLQPALGGVLYTTETLHKLITIPSVAAIKEASFDAMRFLQVKAALESASRKITFLTGNDNFICESFILGAEGALLGFSTLGTREQVMMLDAVRRGDITEARELGSRLQPLADVIFAPPVTDYRARTKEALKMLEVLENTTVRPPLLPIPESELETIRCALHSAGLLLSAVNK
ncbi:MAG: dihydrodipicolinate synthase family protein [Anaerolineae bacterium]|nr:dihydrodipicolinate synthase family protein [Anaerolineae bacterium]MCI0608275.1 dihydrodipicolinate synthase family protein [Anaerolineae bacterium]